jgi:hypothetical protein
LTDISLPVKLKDDDNSTEKLVKTGSTGHSMMRRQSNWQHWPLHDASPIKIEVAC